MKYEKISSQKESIIDDNGNTIGYYLVEEKQISFYQRFGMSIDEIVDIGKHYSKSTIEKVEEKVDKIEEKIVEETKEIVEAVKEEPKKVEEKVDAIKEEIKEETKEIVEEVSKSASEIINPNAALHG